jgi:hypothetical protein
VRLRTRSRVCGLVFSSNASPQNLGHKSLGEREEDDSKNGVGVQGRGPGSRAPGESKDQGKQQHPPRALKLLEKKCDATLSCSIKFAIFQQKAAAP